MASRWLSALRIGTDMGRRRPSRSAEAAIPVSPSRTRIARAPVTEPESLVSKRSAGARSGSGKRTDGPPPPDSPPVARRGIWRRARRSPEAREAASRRLPRMSRIRVRPAPGNGDVVERASAAARAGDRLVQRAADATPHDVAGGGRGLYSNAHRRHSPPARRAGAHAATPHGGWGARGPANGAARALVAASSAIWPRPPALPAFRSRRPVPRPREPLPGSGGRPRG